MYYERAKAGVKEDLDTLSVESVQTCLLIANYCGVEGLLDLKSLYAGRLPTHDMPQYQFLILL